jgi:heme/copper-type cytochrome/quinol oxidase subunit 3
MNMIQLPLIFQMVLLVPLFLLLLGFHGCHVLIVYFSCWFVLLGKIILLVDHHVGFECATWYWHFVDAIWLVVFTLPICGLVVLFFLFGFGSFV